MRLTCNQRLNARQLRKSMTDAERLLWQHLRDREKFGVKFRRQFPLGPYIADFICLERKLIVEVDGSQHMEQVSYDLERSRWLEADGFRVLRFWNNDVLTNVEGVWLALHELREVATDNA